MFKYYLYQFHSSKEGDDFVLVSVSKTIFPSGSWDNSISIVTSP
jgi:hypothetical protein